MRVTQDVLADGENVRKATMSVRVAKLRPTGLATSQPSLDC